MKEVISYPVVQGQLAAYAPTVLEKECIFVYVRIARRARRARSGKGLGELRWLIGCVRGKTWKRVRTTEVPREEIGYFLKNQVCPGPHRVRAPGQRERCGRLIRAHVREPWAEAVPSETQDGLPILLEDRFRGCGICLAGLIVSRMEKPTFEHAVG